MLVLVLWLVFAAVVGTVANARGRSSIGWFLLAIVISPLLAIIFVLVLPNLRHEQLLREAIGTRETAQLSPLSHRGGKLRHHALFGGRSSRETIDRKDAVFQTDGVYAGVPYRVTGHGSIDAVMHGRIVRFSTFEQFTAAMAGAPGREDGTIG